MGTDATANKRTSSVPPDYKPAASRKARKLIERIRNNAGDVKAVEELEKYYAGQGDHPSQSNLLEGWGSTLEDHGQAAEAFMKASEVVLAGLGDRPRALFLCERALARMPTHKGALSRLQALLEGDEDYVHLEQRLRYLAKSLDQADAEPEYQASVLFKLAKVHHLHLADSSRASHYYRQSLELSPRFVPSIVGARQLYLSCEQYPAAAVLFDFHITAEDNPAQKIALLLELSRLRSDRMNDIGGAVVALRRLLDLDGSHVIALRDLVRLLLRRAPDQSSQAGELDAVRAAELSYRLARLVPRAEAVEHLDLCLELNPTHEKATALRKERLSHGATGVDKGSPQAVDGLSQRELDGMATRRMDPIDEGSSDVKAWLSSGSHEPINAVSTGQLGPIEAPAVEPTPQQPDPIRRSQRIRRHAANLSARLKRVKDKTSERRASAAPPPHPEPALVEEDVPAARAEGSQPPPSGVVEIGQLPELPALPSHAASLSDALVEEVDRIPLEVNVGATTETNFYVGFEGQIQCGGVFVPTYGALTVGTSVNLLVTLPGNFETRIHGHVRFVRDAFDFDLEDIPGMGIQFDTMTPQGLALIQRFCEKRTALFFDD